MRRERWGAVAMTLFKNVRSTRPQYASLRIPATLFLMIGGIPNVLDATELKSAGEPGRSSAAGNQTGSTRDTIVDGDTRLGKGLFEKHCVTCHGPRGRGDGIEIAGANVADLSSAATQRKLDVDLLTTIHEGRPGKVMPSWKWRLSAQQAKDVLAYVRTLRK
jgi:mono/diheme cytochrome c family protein